MLPVSRPLTCTCTRQVGSLVPRLHPAHARRRGLVSQVQILGLALEGWSNQWNRRAAFIIMLKREQVLQFYRSKWYHYSNLYSTLNNYKASVLPLAQGLWHQTPSCMSASNSACCFPNHCVYLMPSPMVKFPRPSFPLWFCVSRH